MCHYLGRTLSCHSHFFTEAGLRPVSLFICPCFSLSLVVRARLLNSLLLCFPEESWIQHHPVHFQLGNYIDFMGLWKIDCRGVVRMLIFGSFMFALLAQRGWNPAELRRSPPQSPSPLANSWGNDLTALTGQPSYCPVSLQWNLWLLWAAVQVYERASQAKKFGETAKFWGLHFFRNNLSNITAWNVYYKLTFVLQGSYGGTREPLTHFLQSNCCCYCLFYYWCTSAQSWLSIPASI